MSIFFRNGVYIGVPSNERSNGNGAPNKPRTPSTHQAEPSTDTPSTRQRQQGKPTPTGTHADNMGTVDGQPRKP